MIFLRGWIVESNQGNSHVILKREISESEGISVLVVADERNDFVHLDEGVDFYTLHCFHNIGMQQSLIQKQLVYTISSCVHCFWDLFLTLVWSLLF